MDIHPSLSTEDKVWAAIAHASALFAMWGPVVPLIIWFTQRKRSAYVRFHALQAMCYQVLFIWVGFAVMILLMIGMFVLMVPLMAEAERNAGRGSPLEGLLPLLIILPILGVFVLYAIPGILGAIAVIMGREFRYPFFGASLARKVKYAPTEAIPLSDEAEDNVVAAVSHSTAIVMMVGLLTPVVVWLTQKDRSAFLRFQALQAAIYQILGFSVYIAITAGYMVAFMLAIPVIGFTSGDSSSGGPGGVLAAMLIFVPMACLMVVMYIGGPLYHLFAFIASLRTLRGRDYHYPILGGLLSRRMQPAEAAK